MMRRYLSAFIAAFTITFILTNNSAHAERCCTAKFAYTIGNKTHVFAFGDSPTFRRCSKGVSRPARRRACDDAAKAAREAAFNSLRWGRVCRQVCQLGTLSGLVRDITVSRLGGRGRAHGVTDREWCNVNIECRCRVLSVLRPRRLFERRRSVANFIQGTCNFEHR